MRLSFFLSALMFATVHSSSRFFRSVSTAASSVGGGVLSSVVSSLSFSLVVPEFRLESGWFKLGLESRRTLTVLELLFAARSMFGIKITAAIPSPANSISTSARIPTSQGQVLRWFLGAYWGGMYAPGG